MTDAPPAQPRISRGFEALPIFWQLLGLCLLVLILSLAINFALVLFSPPPQPHGYRLSEAVTAITKGEAKLANGKTLRAITVKKPPSTEKVRDGRFRLMSQIIRDLLARKLNIKPDRITVIIDDFKPRGGFSMQGPGRGDRPGAAPDDRVMPAWSGGPPQGMGNGRDPGPRLFIREIESVRVPPQPGNGTIIERNGPPGDFMPDGRPVSAQFSQSFSEQVSFPPFSAVIKQPDGLYRVLVPPRNWLDPWQWRLIIGLGLTTLCIVPLAFLLSKRLSAPIVSLAEAASHMGFGPDATPLKVSGPRELRAATDVLNVMQVRLKSYVENRTALITAIAHDLKTPLARLRLRVEILPSEYQGKFNADITHMDSLINSALSFAGSERLSLSLVPLDLSALIESLCEDLQEVHPIREMQIEPGLTIAGDATSLKRILTNLIENALRYGGGACDVSAATSTENPAMATLIIRDDGTGLPDNLLEAVFEPFFRLESSRNRATGGVGLGLSLARKLTEAHKGTLTLRNRTDGVGLEAVITLPKWVKAA